MKITALEPQEHAPDRWSLFLDGQFALGLAGAVVVAEGLVVGQELSQAEVERLRAREEEGRVFDAALRFLAARPRSRAETRRRLLAPHPKRPTPSPEVVERALDRLHAMGLLDDREFADFWVENRERFSPRSSRALGQELRQRGVDRETIASVSEPDRDEQRALAAGRQKLRSLAGLEYDAFKTKLGGFLMRRGFGYGVARQAIHQLWRETHGEPVDDDDADLGTE